MSWPPVTLAIRYPQFHELIDDVTDLAWLTLVWDLRAEAGDAQALLEPGSESVPARIAFHLDLLDVYLSATGVDATRWSTSVLLRQFTESLRELGVGIERLFEDHDRHDDALSGHGLAIYRLVIEVMQEAKLGGWHPIDKRLHLADTCFAIMTELEYAQGYPPLSESA